MTAVSCETDRLRVFADLLLRWQKSINLVAPSTLPDFEARHFEDSKRVVPFVKGTSLTDFGSGAGFPGMVVAMLRPDVHVTLLEADQRKCSFLKAVSRETNTPVTIVNKRIELRPAHRTDTITARALAPLEDLVKYASPYLDLNASLRMVFMKGKGYEDEVRKLDPAHGLNVQINPRGDGVICVLEKAVSGEHPVE